MKKWYIASRMSQRFLVNNFIETIKKEGDTIAYEWSSLGSLAPYYKHQEECSRVAQNITTAIMGVDVFILISDREGTDMFVELGIALASLKKPRIYIIGEYNKRSLMHFHPQIIHKDSFEEVLACEKIIT